jgi:hypothetical protein
MFLNSIALLVHEADNLTNICEPTGYTVWDPQNLAILRVYTSTAC